MSGYRLNEFSLPNDFRGASAIKVQLWWLVQHWIIHNTPQFMYGFRRFLYRIFGAEIGKKVIIRPSVTTTYPWKLKIGDYSWIGDEVVLYNLGEITIGENTIISQKSYLCTGSHDYASHTFTITKNPIQIGNSCWIAADVFIMPGVTIANNIVIAARSTIYQSLSKKGFYKGTPVEFQKEINYH